MFLQTNRLILRKLEESDFEDYCAYNLNDSHRDRMMGRDTLDTVEKVRMNFDWLKDKEEHAYALILKETDRMIGNITVYNRLSLPPLPQLADKQGKGLSFGISGKYQRQGLMEEALRAVITHLFSQEATDFINCGCFDFNTPSLRLQTKLGFNFLVKETFEIDGENFTAIENILWKKGHSKHRLCPQPDRNEGHE